MEYAEWERSVPDCIRGDALWAVKAYRLALFLAEQSWQDAARLAQDRRGRAIADQLYRAVCSISANIAEGYSRGSPRERAHFYEYSLGSARESRDWYFKARQALGEELAGERLALLTQVIRLLLTMVPEQRSRSLKEDPDTYLPGELSTPN